jgi:hypothetical protein
MNRVCSIFSQLLQLFSRVEFEAASIKRSAMREGLPVGASSWPCCSVNWAGRIACGRFAKD